MAVTAFDHPLLPGHQTGISVGQDRPIALAEQGERGAAAMAADNVPLDDVTVTEELIGATVSGGPISLAVGPATAAASPPAM